jgi:hypothetical protein
MDAESWYRIICPKCEFSNWVNNGDESDLSGVDIEGYKCWQCGHIEYVGVDYEFDAEVGGWESVKDCCWELGRESPL